MKIALVGQPNSGKSTVFNAVAGYRSLTSNFAGTTVEYTHGQARVGGAVLELADLPGLYSLTPTSPMEATSREFLLAAGWDVIVNVVDASQLARSLELTLELLDLEAPLVVCLNMMDEAARKGMTIDSRALGITLGVPVVEAIAARGRGIIETFRTAQAVGAAGRNRSRAFVYAPDAEVVVEQLAEKITSISSSNASPEMAKAAALAASSTASIAVAEAAVAPAPVFPPARFKALQWMQSDPRQIRREEPTAAPAVEWAQAEIALRTGQPADAAISAARHAACLTLFERVARVARPRADWREQLDRLVMHPVWGYAVLLVVFLGFFRLVFDVGKLGEARILAVFDALVALLAQHMNPQGALFASVKGAVLGTAGAVAIVLPYLVPFLVGLAILEDIGYLSRVGYLMDAAMHRLGLHGTATLPVLVGYGCSVPAVMATRILASRRDRFIAAFLAVLVPCSARMTVIFALVGFYLGANYALGIYALNLFVVAVAGHLLARIWPEISPGMLMEVPAYRVPAPRVVALKTWWRLREFVVVAFPLLVVGSVVLSLVDFYGWQHGINTALSPLTALLGLPRPVGLTLIFGVLRKELSLLMLMQALGTTHVLGVMTAAQILIFTLFVTFYLPCMATLASMLRELGWRLTLAASAALLALAIVISLAARAVLVLF
ncbi:MAG: ferrous iron transport protein B [Acidobacteriia bacterium]|nr:ferrous iron transport protein B [Terriglobia bacterium]